MRVDGPWRGFYVQDFLGRAKQGSDVRGGRHPIEAWLETDGSLMSGNMKDLAPVREVPYAEVIESGWQRMGWIDRLKANRYASCHPDCIFRVSLFPDSVVEGHIDGNAVSFAKTYAGPCEHGYINGAVEQITRVTSQTIHYYGELSEDGNLISGTYELPTLNAANQVFELRRL